MVAACRALETEEPDAFARDPFAARLAGERGFAILNGVSWSMVLRFGMAVRTRFLDELLAEALAIHPIKTVLSVGCGLDTRPWRLELPPDLRWIEVDFPDVLDYKHGLLAGEKAHCRVERLSVDLNDAAQRRAMYEAAGTDPALVITEGVLMYLGAATVDALAAEIPNASGAVHWISDITTSQFNQAIRGGGTSASGFEHSAPLTRWKASRFLRCCAAAAGRPKPCAATFATLRLPRIAFAASLATGRSRPRHRLHPAILRASTGLRAPEARALSSANTKGRSQEERPLVFRRKERNLQLFVEIAG
jgi:methyltransferase (TIGR00027 family)